jgi:hypothetical protein
LFETPPPVLQASRNRESGCVDFSYNENMESGALAERQCPVCIETSKKTFLECSHCKYAACQTCSKRYIADRPLSSPSCMSCFRVFEVRVTFATKELDNVRREGLFAVDSALHVPMQTRVFPLIHEYEEMIREWRDQREVLLAAERRRFQIQSDLFDAKMDMLVKSGVNFAGGHCGDSISRRKTKQGRKSTPEVDRLTEALKAVETILFRLRLTFRNKNNIINLVYQVIDHPARHPHSKTRRRKVAERNVDNVRASKGDHRVSTGPRGVHDTRVGEMQNLYTAARSRELGHRHTRRRRRVHQRLHTIPSEID